MSQLHAFCKMHAAGMQKGCALLIRPSEPNSSNKKEKREIQGQQGDATWQLIKADLYSIKEGLEKEEGNAHHAQRLNEVIARGTHAFSTTTAAQGVEARLERIEALLQTSVTKPYTTYTGKKSWADIAATGARQAGTPQAIQPIRHTVRVQLAQAKGLTNEEILKEVKKTITKATAIRVL